MSIRVKQGKFDLIVFWGLAGLLVFAPLAMSLVPVWACTVATIWVFALLVLWFVDRLVFPGAPVLEWVGTPVNLLLVLILIVIGLQMVPLPASWIALISPRTFADKMRIYELLSRSGEAITVKPGWISIAYSIHPARVEMIKLAAAFGTFFLVLNTLKSRWQIDVLSYLLIFVGFLAAIYTIVYYFSPTPGVAEGKGRPGATMRVLAGYLEMLIPFVLGFMLAQRKRKNQVISGLKDGRAFMGRVLRWFSPDASDPGMKLLFFCAVLMGTALLLCASPIGILSLGASMSLMSVLFFSKKRFRKYGLVALGICLIILILGLYFRAGPGGKQFRDSGAFQQQQASNRTMIHMLRDYPVLGVGWGNSFYRYPRYAAENDAIDQERVGRGNTWQKVGAELGGVGGILVVVTFAGYLFRMIRKWQQRNDPHAVGITAGALGALLTAGLHSYLNYNLIVPAHILILAAILGIGYAAVYRQGRGYLESFFYRVRRIRLTRARRMVVVGMVLIVFGAVSFNSGRHLLAEAKCPTQHAFTQQVRQNPGSCDIQNAIRYNPSNAEYYFKFADYIMRRIEGGGLRLEIGGKSRRDVYITRAMESLRTAVRLNPLRGEYWYRLGMLVAMQKDDPYDYLNRYLPLSDDILDMAVDCAARDPDMLFNVGRYWVRRSVLLAKRNSRFPAVDGNHTRFHEDGIRKFQGLFKRSLGIDPHRWKEAVDRVWEYYPHDAVVLGTIPEDDVKLRYQVLQWLGKK
jgi:hypothetical protein